MNRMPLPSRRVAGRFPHSRAAFTLIELLTVMAIILILAGLIIGVAGQVQSKAAGSRAEAEIKSLSSALESYRVDNGTYPRDTAGTGATDTLNAQTGAEPTAAAYTTSGKFLYKALSGFTGATTAPTKSYFPFAPTQLSTGSAAPTTDTYMIDPFGFCYGYSTINQYATEQAANVSTSGYNPTFDLWSTLGYSSSGKQYPSDMTTASAKAALWSKNW